MSYAFPIMSPQQIVENLAFLDLFPITIDDLRNPQYAVVNHMYEKFLEYLLEWEKSPLERTGEEAPHELQYPDLHKESIAKLEFYRMLIKQDLYNPTSKRLRAHLSGIINFAKFREGKIDDYAQFTVTTDELVDSKIELEERRDEAIQLIERLRGVEERDAVQIAELTQENDQLAEDVLNLNMKQAAMRSDISRLKNHNTEVKHVCESLKYQISNTEADLEIIKEQLVQSPRKVEAAIHQMSADIEAEKKHVSKLHQESDLLAKKVTVMVAMEGDLRKSNILLRECIQEEIRSKESDKTINEYNHTIETLNETLVQMQTSTSHLDKQLKSANEKIVKLTKQQLRKEADAMTDLENTKEEKKRYDSEMEDNQAKIDENNDQISRLEERLLELQAEHIEEMNAVKDKYASLFDQVTAYHQTIFGGIRM